MIRVTVRKTSVLVLLIFLGAGAAAQEERTYAGAVGVAPTTMGTVGENLSFDFTPLPYLTIGIAGSHEKIHQHDEEFEKLGGPLLGDVTKDILYGRLSGSGNFSVAGFSVSPVLSIEVTQTDSDTIARVITEVDDGGASYPQDTESFVDIDETELIIDPSIGLDVAFSSDLIRITVNGSWSPLLGSSLSGGFFQTFGDWPVASSLDPADYPVSPDYWWRNNEYELTGRGLRYGVGGSFGLLIAPVGLHISGFGAYRLSLYDENTTVSNTYYYPYRMSSTSDTEIAEVISADALAVVDVTHQNLEGGISFGLVFLKDLLNLSGTPSLDVSYVRVIRDIEFRYFEPEESREKWIEDYSYLKFAATWGI